MLRLALILMSTLLVQVLCAPVNPIEWNVRHFTPLDPRYRNDRIVGFRAGSCRQVSVYIRQDERLVTYAASPVTQDENGWTHIRVRVSAVLIQARLTGPQFWLQIICDGVVLGNMLFVVAMSSPQPIQPQEQSRVEEKHNDVDNLMDFDGFDVESLEGILNDDHPVNDDNESLTSHHPDFEMDLMAAVVNGEIRELYDKYPEMSRELISRLYNDMFDSFTRTIESEPTLTL
jgi:hypothetical protein